MSVPDWVWGAIRDDDWWHPAYKRLILFARKRMAGYIRQRGNSAEFVLGIYTDEDFVLQTLEKMLTGVRRIPPRVADSGDRTMLLIWLTDVVASMINNVGRGKDINTVTQSSFEDELPSPIDLIEDPHGTSIIGLTDLYLTLSRHLEDDPELIGVLKAWLDGCKMPQDFAAELETSVNEATNLLRRFRRRLGRLAEEGILCPWDP